jgi:hypothetical protein
MINDHNISCLVILSLFDLSLLNSLSLLHVCSGKVPYAYRGKSLWLIVAQKKLNFLIYESNPRAAWGLRG